MTEASEEREGVGIVWDDQAPGGRTLALCASQAEAAAVVEEVLPFVPGGVGYSFFGFGYRFNTGTGYFKFPSSED